MLHQNTTEKKLISSLISFRWCFLGPFSGSHPATSECAAISLYPMPHGLFFLYIYVSLVLYLSISIWPSPYISLFPYWPMFLYFCLSIIRAYIHSSIHLSMHPFIHPSVHPSMHPYVCSSITRPFITDVSSYLSNNSICPSITSTCPCIYVCLSIYLCLNLYLYLSHNLCEYLYLYLSVYLCAYLSIYISIEIKV